MLLQDTSEGRILHVPSAEMENGSSETQLGSLYDRLCGAEHSTVILRNKNSLVYDRDLTLNISGKKRGRNLQPEAESLSDFYLESVKEIFN